jgi:hypothetical protein
MANSRKKVIVRIAGGLGNQLFEYAAARRLAMRNDVPLTLDHISGFPRDFYKRNFLLDHFNIRCDYIDPGSSYASFWGRLCRRIQLKLNRNRDLQRKTYVMEENTSKLDARMLDLRVTRPIYLEGYWQHEDYFKDIREQLCDELTLKTPHDPVNIELAKRINSVNSVCLHVRRLHGVPNVANAKPLETKPAQHIDVSYYSRAVERIGEKVKDPHFFVFADYPDWARENINVPYPIEYVTHNGADKDYEDFWLMGQCKHFIVANSTFSWWAAWLARNPDKIIIAPKASIGFALQSTPSSWLLL